MASSHHTSSIPTWANAIMARSHAALTASLALGIGMPRPVSILTDRV